MVTAIEDAMAAQPVGVVSVSVDGQTINYSRDQAMKELLFWEKRADREAGKRSMLGKINLENA